MSSIRERGSLIPPRDLPLTPPASRTYAPDNTPAASSDGLLFTTSSRPTDPLPRFATANAPVAAAAAHAAHTLPSRGAPGRPSLGSSIDPITIDSDEERSSPPRTPKAFRTTTIASPSSPVRRRLLDPAVLQSSALLRALDDPNNSPVRAPPLSELGTTGPKTAATPTLSSHATPSAPKPPAVRPLPLSATPRAAASASANNSTTPRTVHHPTSASASKPAFPGKSATIPGASRFRVPVPPLTSPGKSKSSPNKTAPGSRKPAFSGTARPMPSAIQSIITRSVSITSDSTLPEVDEVIKATLASRTTDSALIPHDVIDLTGDDDASMSPASSVLTINSEDEVIAHLTPPFQSSPTLVPKTPKMGIQQGLTSPKKSGDVTSLEIH
ncbi:hypothetical protein CALVIDRAFT_538049 [Calocera viscosa TUFC12733]|uniref:Uncharacterized protein n=1 Tax=Calocera viscosa (strain TUFC12733) TaxID=1330018 RepID=A0A167LG15_CALVF|nr:hypothetical protein CALVIDRAFT_538049 [Calocera viscosa TUFC12733]